MLHKIIKGVSILIFLAGACILAFPWARGMYADLQNERQIKEFQATWNTLQSNETEKDNGSGEKTGMNLEIAPDSFPKLRADMESYNLEIYENNQDGLHDAWDYEEESFSLQDYGLDSEMIGYLESDAMDICIPLYLGASSEHLADGLAVLGQTSMPIGGENTNCVIAGHRGWQGAAMFRDIELLQEGDIIWITNLWEHLAYRVVGITVITPDNIDAVGIVDGQDMLTLFTCHPYTDNYQRYVVYCARTYDAVYGETTHEKPGNSDDELNGLLDEREGEQPAFISSSDKIRQEQILSFAGLAGAVLLLIILVIVIVRPVRKRRRRRKK